MRALQESLERSSPFEIGLIPDDGAIWQLIHVLTEDAPLAGAEGIHEHGWRIVAVENNKWIFLEVVLIEQNLKYWFAFDCNSSQHLTFIKGVLRSKRLMVHFSNGVGIRLDPSPADSLVEDNGELLEALIPRWQQYYFSNAD